MIYDVQKAGIMKRMSAWLLDAILLLILAVGLAGLFAVVVDYDSYVNDYNGYYSHYETEYGVTFDVPQEKWEAMTQAEKDNYDAAYKALIEDEQAMRAYNMILNLTLIELTGSILLAYLILEFAIPLWLKNGQTVGKKVFGIALMRTHGVKINPVCLFIRTVLGKYTVETMIPVLVVLMLIFGIAGLPGTILIFCLLAVQLALFLASRNHTVIHDRMADTVAVDMASQMIFDSEEALLEYKKKVSAEKADKQLS